MHVNTTGGLATVLYCLALSGCSSDGQDAADDSCGNVTHDAAQSSVVVCKGQAATLSTKTGVRVVIPAGAVAEKMTFAVKPGDGKHPDHPGYITVHGPHEVLPRDVVFKKPVTVYLPVDESETRAFPLRLDDETQLRAGTGTDQSWNPIGDSRREGAYVVFDLLAGALVQATTLDTSWAGTPPGFGERCGDNLPLCGEGLRCDKVGYCRLSLGGSCPTSGPHIYCGGTHSTCSRGVCAATNWWAECNPNASQPCDVGFQCMAAIDRCRPADATAACTSNAECDPGLECRGGACKLGDGASCIPAVASWCTSGACNDGYCAANWGAPCTADIDCPDGSDCGLASGTGTQKVCGGIGSKCLDDGCGAPGLECLDFKCALTPGAGCTDSTQCGDQSECRAGANNTMVCGGFDSPCEFAGRGCATGLTCTDSVCAFGIGHHCLDSAQCGRSDCAAPAPGSSSLVCGGIDSPCASKGDCAAELLCADHVCKAPLPVGASCSAADADLCEKSQCKPAAPGGSDLVCGGFDSNCDGKDWSHCATGLECLGFVCKIQTGGVCASEGDCGEPDRCVNGKCE